jgi:hypothetical protein
MEDVKEMSEYRKEILKSHKEMVPDHKSVIKYFNKFEAKGVFMTRNNLKLSDWFLESKILIENSINDKEILEAVKIYGFDESKIKIGKELYESLQDLINKQKKEYGEQYEATENLQKSWEKSDASYIKALKISRIVFQDNIKAQNSMMLNGKRKQSISGWLEQAEAFYKNLTSDDGLMQEMQKFGYTQAKLDSEYELVKDVIDKNLKQKKETGEAQEATELRDRKIDELDKWLSDYRQVVKVALEDNPQKLEKLGIIAKRK